MKTHWFSLTSEGWHYLVAGLLRDRQLELALSSFREMQAQSIDPEPWLVNLLIYTFLAASAYPEVTSLLQLRISLASSTTPFPSALWSYVLTTSAAALHHPLVAFVWRRAVETSYLNPSTGTCTAVLQSCARAGDHTLAKDVLRVLHKRSTLPAAHHHESLIEAHLAASDLRGALETVLHTSSTVHPPTDASLRPLFLYLRAKPARPAAALTILQEMHDLRTSKATPTPIPVPAVNAIIEAHVHVSALDAALAVYKALPTLCCPHAPSTHTFNALLRGAAGTGRKDVAMFLAAEMRALGVTPDALTYDRLMLACLQQGRGGRGGVEDDCDGDSGRWRRDLRDAWRYWGELRGHGWWARRGTVTVLARKSCEAGEGRVWGLLRGWRMG